MLMQVISVVTPIGEFVGKLLSENAHEISLSDPRMIMVGSEGFGFSEGVCMTGVRKPSIANFQKSNIIVTTPTNPLIADKYREFVSGIILQ